jgi:hypothetical protein
MISRLHAREGSPLRINPTPARAVEIVHPEEIKFSPPGLTGRNQIQARVVLPGSLFNPENRYNFVANIRNVLAGAPLDIEAGIYWQPSRKDPSKLVRLHFHVDSKLMREISQFKSFVLIVRVSGPYPAEFLTKVHKVIINVLSDHKFLRMASYSGEAEKKSRSYLEALTRLEAPKKLRSHFRGGGRPAKEVDADAIDVNADENDAGEAEE